MTKQKYRTETWKGKRVRVVRNAHGMFLSWHRIRSYRRRQSSRQGFAQLTEGLGTKRVAVYGKAWTRRGIESRRWEIHARTGSELFDAVRIAAEHPPRKRFNIIDAEDIGPDDLEPSGEWVDRPDINS